MQDIFAYTEFRSFSVCTVRAFLSDGALYIGYRNKVLPLVALVTPLYVGFGSLHFYVFGVNAVLAVGSVNSVLAVFSIGSVFSVGAVNAIFSVCTVGSVFTVYAVLSVCTVFSVGAVNAVFAVKTVLSVSAVLAVFSGSARKLGKRHKVAPIGFVAVFPLDRRAVVPHLRQCSGVGFSRFAASGSKYNAKCNDNAIDSLFHFPLPPFRYCERYLSTNRATPCFKTSIWV